MLSTLPATTQPGGRGLPPYRATGYDINLVTGAGELSITAVLDFEARTACPARIFYIADFDPAGHGMPVSVARKTVPIGKKD